MIYAIKTKTFAKNKTETVLLAQAIKMYGTHHALNDSIED